MDKNSSDGVPLPQRYGAILTIVLGLTMAVLDGAIANVALPTIASDLNASPAASIWIVNAYQIAIVIALLPLSFLGDMVGYRRIYKIGLVVFIFTSLACALSRSLEMLTFARVAQGLGGAALMSVNTALIRLIYPQRFLGRGMGINSFVVAVSSAAGPTIATAILSLASWQWLFLINVPLGIVAFVLAMRFLPPNSARSKIIRFDLPSAIMNALTFGLLITALSGFAQGQSTQLVLAEVAAMLVVGFFFVRRQLTMPVPLLPVDLLRIPLFSLYLHFHLLLLRADAGDGLPALFSAVDDGAQRSGDWSAANAVAVSDHGDGAAGRLFDREMSCRAAGGCRPADYGLRPVRPGAAALVALRSGYHLAHGAVRRRLRAVSVAEQPYHRRLGSEPS
ncbi:transport protein [Klebsiella pneumoniae]|uniref:Transport protein n=1 Tax=Klebsiella pneumoniae TaxID=573 RepID=A0A377Y2G4_KLEPN|nr:transport protein [Klebsiella pneumoniae]